MTGGESFDLVVCGAGSAGMPCAIAAAEAGARVAVLEKSAEVGGTLHVAGGHLSAAGTCRQAERGIVDHPDLHFEDVIRICGDTANRELVRLAVDEAAPTLDWLDSLGFAHAPESPQKALIYKPYGVERLHWGDAPGQKGPVILRALRSRWDSLVGEGRIRVYLGTAWPSSWSRTGASSGCGPTGRAAGSSCAAPRSCSPPAATPPTPRSSPS